MGPDVVAFSNQEGLADFVHQVLCKRDSLDAEQAPLFHTPLNRRGRACGVVFHVEGPRLMHTSAVWSADDDRIIFYDSTGTRFREVALSESPPLADFNPPRPPAASPGCPPASTSR